MLAIVSAILFSSSYAYGKKHPRRFFQNRKFFWPRFPRFLSQHTVRMLQIALMLKHLPDDTSSDQVISLIS